MASWTVWEHPRHGERRAERARFVRDGFSWLAFLFAPLWLLANGMWAVLLLFVALAALVDVVVIEIAGDEITGLAALALALWFGFEARALKRWSLDRRGWELMAIVDADSMLAAERRYFTAREAGEAGPAPAPAPDPAPWTPKPTPAVVGVLPEPTR